MARSTAAAKGSAAKRAVATTKSTHVVKPKTPKASPKPQPRPKSPKRRVLSKAADGAAGKPAATATKSKAAKPDAKVAPAPPQGEMATASPEVDATVSVEHAGPGVAEGNVADVEMAQSVPTASATTDYACPMSPGCVLKRLFQWPSVVLKAFATFHQQMKLKSTSEQAASVAHRTLHSWMAHEPDLARRGSLGEDSEEQGALQELVKKVGEVSMSTAFSGIESPSTATLMLSTSISHHLGRPVDPASIAKPDHRYAIEWLPQARDQILNHPHCPEHVFGDMMDFWSDAIRPRLESLVSQHLVDSVLAPLIRATRNSAAVTAWCYKHDRMCKIEETDVHVAGTPCVDFSKRGSMLHELGNSYLAFLAWCSVRRRLGDKVVVQENVPEFPNELLERMLGDMYYLEWTTLNPVQYGFPIARGRKWVIMRHKLKTSAFLSPFSYFAADRKSVV